jgi:putative transposase
VGRIRRDLLVGEDSTNHCTWRVHNLDLAFEEPGARAKYLELMGKYKARHGMLIRSYCLMGTHPHVVCTSTNGQPAFSAFWKAVNQGFARWYNDLKERRGQVVMERLRSPRIEEGSHLLRVMRYGDLNPVRAGLVRSPRDWAWSSYRHYAFGEEDPLVDDAPEYRALGRTAPERRKAYRALLAQPLGEGLGVRRPELVVSWFIGSEAWVKRRCRVAGLSPPEARA